MSQASTADDLAEELYNMLDVCKGLSTRLHFYKTHLASDAKPKCLTNPDYDKLRKALLKPFPVQATVDTKVQGYESFLREADHVMRELQDVYFVFVDAREFVDAAYSCLVKTSVAVPEFKLDLNPALLELFMDLLIGYAKIQLLLGSIGEAKVVLTVYSCACKCVNGEGTGEVEYNNLAEFCNVLLDKPFKHMQVCVVRGVPGAADAAGCRSPRRCRRPPLRTC
jgi:hypothetical protein